MDPNAKKDGLLQSALMKNASTTLKGCSSSMNCDTIILVIFCGKNNKAVVASPTENLGENNGSSVLQTAPCPSQRQIQRILITFL
jgi:hypothetical protein